MEFDKNYWENRYLENDIPWDTGTHHRELPAIIKSFGLKGKYGYVPGCGYGYDAAFLAQQGAEIWASDISLTAIERARAVAEKYSGPVTLIHDDMINPGEKYTGFFDFVFEYTTICSVSPEIRSDFITGMSRLLKDNGLYITILFPLSGITENPPYPVENIEFKNLAAPHFKLIYFQKAIDSIKPRAGRESLHVYEKIK